MPKNKEIEITLTLKDEATKKIQSFRSGVKEFSKETKDSLAPILQLRRTWMYTSIAIGATIGTFMKGAQEIAKLREEYIKLDTTAIKLGISSEQLSKKLYGFNIGTFYARIGSTQAAMLLDDFKNTILFLKTKAAEEIAKFNIETRAQQIFQKKEAFAGSESMTEKGWFGGWFNWLFSDERKKLIKESREEAKKEAIKETNAYQEIQALKSGKAAEFENRIQQLSKSTYEYKKYLLNQDLENYRIAGIKEIQLAKYRTFQEQEILYARFGFTKWSDYMDNNFRQTISSMRDTLSTFFNDVFTGELKKGQEYFAQFGNNILKIFSQMLAEMAARWILLGEGFGKNKVGSWMGIISALTSLGGGASNILTRGSYSIGGQTLASSAHIGRMGGTYIGMAEGGAGIVRRPTLFLAGESGPERYRFDPLSRNREANAEREVHIHYHSTVIIKAWDFSDIYNNRDEIKAIINESLRLQGSVHKSIRSYGG